MPETGNIFSLSFLITWLFAVYASFERGLRGNPYVRRYIAEFITNLTGYQFHEEWVMDLFLVINCLILFIFFVYDKFRFFDIFDYFKKKKRVYSDTSPYKKKSKNKKKKRK